MEAGRTGLNGHLVHANAVVDVNSVLALVTVVTGLPIAMDRASWKEFATCSRVKVFGTAGLSGLLAQPLVVRGRVHGQGPALLKTVAICMIATIWTSKAVLVLPK